MVVEEEGVAVVEVVMVGAGGVTMVEGGVVVIEVGITGAGVEVVVGRSSGILDALVSHFLLSVGLSPPRL